MVKKLVVIISLIITGCTDASFDATFGDYNEIHTVSCFSGGKEIFRGKTTGKVLTLDGGGWAFRTTDGHFMKTFADCFVYFKKD